MRSAFIPKRSNALPITRTSEGLDCRQDPNTAPIGRQPFNIQIAPSKHYPWYGSIAGAEVVNGPTGPVAVAGGDRFTAEQMHAMKRQGIDPNEVEVMQVKRQATTMEMWIPRGQLPPVYAFDCPVVGRRIDKVKVITPSGAPKLVFPDGWGHHPIRIARGTMGEPLPPPMRSSGEA